MNPKDEITNWLTLLRRCASNNGVPEGYTYAGIGDFLLRHGQWYEPRPLPASVNPGPARACFWNALTLAKRRRGYSYVEGYATADIQGLPFPCHHAWNLDRDGRLIDNTWAKPGLAYFGVVFSPQRVQQALRFDNTVLDNPHSRHIIFKQPWTGEAGYEQHKRGKK